MGPQHPMTHGLWTLKIKVDGETVVDTEPDLGYIHRGVEKICEARDFTQITTYCDRLCYASANTWSHSYIYAVEDLLEVEVPERAEYIRLIAVELQRIASHLMWLGAYGPDIGNLSVMVWCLREREMMMDLLQELGGSRCTTTSRGSGASSATCHTASHRGPGRRSASSSTGSRSTRRCSTRAPSS